ncbi:undecaprenyldiphospho-muramoylpentapeptide beta-N-acetylglucosaminyltransferase [Nakamurella lactea]|uniref:undecaprenyldiphospho-muramoylpentapeptide beta-N-acetylglucosaminyltransferase n=1 Tax=Nakamurella lactea TaxID=459515 RepID=UPI00040BE598|nr:undecaprenyldiphospho-muramoylpentapeptide beta-N-acetylglucosaminyltransferase [Nakamurella lactea]
MSQPSRPLSVLLAGGGTAGHIEPALAVADALRADDPDVRITALGTDRGLETTLVPARGYRLELIPAVPLPRKPSKDLITLAPRMRSAIKATRAIMAAEQVDVVVGFGGYVALPAYLAARKRVPIVIHESNARAGLANKIGARFADTVAVAVEGSGLTNATVIGIPVRPALAGLDRAALRAQAREFFGLDPDAPTLLVWGGSQGAQRINTAVSGAARELADAGIGVLHAHGRKNTVELPDDLPTGAPAYVTVPYLDRMDLAFSAVDLMLGRSGAMTVAETGTVGLPAVYVPLPHGNGEQRLNATGQLEAGSAIIIDDADLTSEAIVSQVIPLLLPDGDGAARFAAMQAAAAAVGQHDVGRELAQLVRAAAGRGAHR